MNVLDDFILPKSNGRDTMHLNDLNDFYSEERPMCTDVADAQVAWTDGFLPPGPSIRSAPCQPSLTRRLKELMSREIFFIDSPEFHQGGVEIPTLPSPKQNSDLRNQTKWCRSTSTYFNALSRIPLLSAEDEKAAFRGMNYLKYRASKLRGRVSLESPQEALADEIDELLAASLALRNRIVEANLRLVVSIAKKFANNHQHFEELLSDGHVTLMQALDKFDYSRGFRFSTYATHAICRAYYRIGKKATRQPIPFDPHTRFTELEIPDSRSSNETAGGQLQAIQALDQLIDLVLDDRERAILIARYGLGRDGDSMTLRDIGTKLELSKERIRQLQVRAIEKLKTAGASLGLLLDEPFDAQCEVPIPEAELS
jgi:RNA polymerase primary sigma factor